MCQSQYYLTYRFQCFNAQFTAVTQTKSKTIKITTLNNCTFLNFVTSWKQCGSFGPKKQKS